MNIKAVARQARVSTATVSRVINNTAFVAPETAERVRSAIDALQFYPDVNARALGSGRSGMYGLIISDITNPYFPELVKAFEDIAVEHHQEILIANTNYDPKRMETCVSRMLQRKVDGVAIMTSEMDDGLIRTFANRSIPLVVMDAEVEDPVIDVIRVNYDAGLNSAMGHLYDLGHRQIGFISGPLSLLPARLRAEAFRKALARRGLSADASWLLEGNHRVDGGAEAVRRLLRSGQSLPTAIITSNDLTAIGAAAAVREHGMRVPEDVSIVGFDGIELSAYTQPALTTLLVPRDQIAAAAFRCLLQHRDAGARSDAASRQAIEPRLLVRSSTAAPPLTSPKGRRKML